MLMPMLWAMLNIVLNACSATLAEDSGLRVLFVFIHFLVSLLFSRKVMHFSDLNAKKCAIGPIRLEVIKWFCFAWALSSLDANFHC